jgi:hypothetical protein
MSDANGWMESGIDGSGQHYIEWQIGPKAWKRAWIQNRTGERDWAGTGRYLNLARVEGPGKGPAGNTADFPVYVPKSEKSDEEILRAFVTAVWDIAGLDRSEP